MFGTFAITLVGVLIWRGCRYGFAPTKPQWVSETVERVRASKPAAIQFNPLYGGLVACAALLLLCGLGPAFEKERGWWAYSPGLFCIPFGVILSSEIMKQAERRRWPAIAAASLILFYSLVFSPLYCLAIGVTVLTLFWGLPFVAMVTLAFWFVWLLASAIWGDEESASHDIVRRNLARTFKRPALACRPVTPPAFRFNLAQFVVAVLATAVTGAVLSTGNFINAFRLLVPHPKTNGGLDTGFRLSGGFFSENPVIMATVICLFVAAGVLLAGEINRVGRRRGWSDAACTALVALASFLSLPALLFAVLVLLENIFDGLCALGLVGLVFGIGWGVAVKVLGGETKTVVVRRQVVRKHLRMPVPGKGKRYTPRYEPKYSRVPRYSDYIRRII